MPSSSFAECFLLSLFSVFNFPFSLHSARHREWSFLQAWCSSVSLSVIQPLSSERDMPKEVRCSRTFFRQHPRNIYINHFSLPNNFCFIAVCAFPYILAFTTDSIEIRLVVNGNLVHTAVVPELQLVASRVRDRKIMFKYFYDMLGSNSYKTLLQPKTKQTKTDTCATCSRW